MTTDRAMKQFWFRTTVALAVGAQTGVVIARPAAQGTVLWQQQFKGGYAHAVALDHQGNVAVAGRILAGAFVWDFSVAKFDRNGTPLWQQTLNGTGADSFDEAKTVAVDNHRNVIAAGVTTNAATLQDFTVAKFDPDGTLLWLQTLNGAANGNDFARSVAVDHNGNVIAAGTTLNVGTYLDFTVAKFDPDGTLLWQRTLNGTGNGGDEATSVTLDNRGDIFAAGVVDGAFTVVKFDRDGTLLWQQGIDSGSANCVAVDVQGNVVAGGGAFAAFTVAKFDGNGTLLWQRMLDRVGPAFDSAISVAVDGQGNVAAAGIVGNNLTLGGFTVAKFDGGGVLLWRNDINGVGKFSGDAQAVAFDHHGNVIAAGSRNVASVVGAFTVAKFDHDGTVLWQQNTVVGGASSVAVDPPGNVVAAGSDFTVAKFAR